MSLSTSLSTLAQFILPYRQLLVGFSGGLDSTVLLHRLMLLRNQQSDLRLRAVHVHHGLSLHADKWVTHCHSICTEWNIPLIVKFVTLQDEGLGIEGQARKVRHIAFSDALLPDEALVTAHHLDDQCETLLLALKRGSGPAGLSAMPSRAVFADTQQLRPLLNTSRSSLEKWANKYDLNWIEDESNQDDSYDRNFLRLRVVPLLMGRWPHFSDAAVRSAQLCAEQEKLLDELLANELKAAISDEGALSIAALQNKSTVRRSALLRRWLAMHKAVMPSRDMLTRIWHEVALAREDANPTLHLNGFEVRRYQGRLWWVPYFPTITNRILHWVDQAKPLTLPHGMGKVSLHPGGHVRLPAESEHVTVRFYSRGALHVVGYRLRRKLKKIWRQHNIPPWRRELMPLLFYGETMIAVAEVFITQEGFAETGMQFTWKEQQKANY